MRSAEVKDFSLKANDFAKGSLPAGGRRADKGAQGTAGTAGPTGAAGTPSPKIYAFVRTGGCCGGAPPLDPPRSATPTA